MNDSTLQENEAEPNMNKPNDFTKIITNILGIYISFLILGIIFEKM
jgi:hypothetical protein